MESTFLAWSCMLACGGNKGAPGGGADILHLARGVMPAAPSRVITELLMSPFVAAKSIFARLAVFDYLLYM